jgi:hypothetical protein
MKLAFKSVYEEILIVSERPHIALHLWVLLGASRLRFKIAIVKLFAKTIHGSFFLKY